MKRIQKSAIISAFSLLAFVTSSAHTHANAGSGVRTQTKMNQDGSFTEFKLGENEQILSMKTYGERKGGNGDRVLLMSIIYTSDDQGRLRSGRIYDGNKNILFRVRYGYHEKTGRLVQENMYDARKKVMKPVLNENGQPLKDANGQPIMKEFPVRKLHHRYDAQGRPARPIAINTPEGKLAEELFGIDGSSHPHFRQ